MAAIHLTSMAKFYTVLLLGEGPKHGYELMRAVQEKIGEKTGPGTIYPLLAKLKRAGYLEVKERGSREKKTYALNAKGREFLRGMVVRFGSMFEIAIEPKLTVCAHCGCKIYAGAHEETIGGKKLKFCCCHCAKSYRESMKK